MSGIPGSFAVTYKRVDAVRETDPQEVFSVWWVDNGYALDVEMRRDDAGAAFVIGVRARREPPVDGWFADGVRPHVSARDVQRMPLAPVVEAALAASTSGPPEGGGAWVPEAKRVLTPKRRPSGRGDKAHSFYKDIAATHRSCAARGDSPAKVIAKQLRVPENTAHQYIWRARQLELLEPSPRSSRRPAAG